MRNICYQLHAPKTHFSRYAEQIILDNQSEFPRSKETTDKVFVMHGIKGPQMYNTRVTALKKATILLGGSHRQCTQFPAFSYKHELS
jgi:hypothetical protein